MSLSKALMLERSKKYKVKHIKQRWWFYLIIGVAFGVFVFYYHNFLSNILARQQAFTPSTGGEIIWLTLSIGIWLVPIIPISIYEAKTSKSKLLTSFASTLTWCASIVSYYLTNALQLAFIGSPTRLELHISNQNDPFFWENWAAVFYQDILVAGIVRWCVVAVLGGLIIGFLISFIYLCFRKFRNLLSTRLFFVSHRSAIICLEQFIKEIKEHL